jgi:hypothetical protein
MTRTPCCIASQHEVEHRRLLRRVLARRLHVEAEQRDLLRLQAQRVGEHQRGLRREEVVAVELDHLLDREALPAREKIHAVDHLREVLPVQPVDVRLQRLPRHVEVAVQLEPEVDAREPVVAGRADPQLPVGRELERQHVRRAGPDECDLAAHQVLHTNSFASGFTPRMMGWFCGT